MPKKIDEMMYILSPSRAYLEPIHIMGPIVHPVKISKSNVIKLLMNGTEVHQYYPDSGKTLKLTLRNINDPNRALVAFNESVNPIEPPVNPVVKTGVKQINDVKLNNAEESTTVIRDNTSDNSRTSVIASLPLTESGKVDESKIEWQKYSKSERREIRSFIDSHK